MARALRDMIVLITGASAGIGRELALQLDRAGSRLALCARRMDRLEELNAQLGNRHFIMRADVADVADCGSFIAQSHAHFGRIDTLVCNAGYGIYQPAWQTSSGDMRAIPATNVLGTTDLIHAAIPVLLTHAKREQFRGQVMIVSSAAARRAVPYLGAYSATKAAQLSIAEALRVELAGEGISVTSVHPIRTPTEFGAAAEESSGITLPRNHGPRQPAEFVARRMIGAIRNPTAEVWPHQATRLAIIFGILFPSLADRALQTFRRAVERTNEPSDTRVT